MSIHLIIAGHGKLKNGGFDPGAIGYIKKGEHRYMKEDLFPRMKEYAKDSTDEFVFFDDYKVNSYDNLEVLAKKYKADTVTEFHYDAFSSSASGGHVIVHKSFAPDSLDLKLRDVIKNMIGSVRFQHKKHAGISGRDNLWNVNRAKKHGINYRLIELGFGTNKKESDIMVKEVDDYARQLVQAFDGVKQKPKKNTTKKKTINVNELADIILRTNVTGTKNRANYLGLSEKEYAPIQNEINKRYSKKPVREQVKPTFIGKRVESVHDGSLRFYVKGSWKDKYVGGTITKGYGFPIIVRKISVDGGSQYQVKNSRGRTYYITASPKFVKVI